MKNVFHTLLVVAFICCSGSIHGMKRPELTAQESLHLPDEVIIPLAAYSNSREKNELMKVCKQFLHCLQNGRDQIIYANPWTVHQYDREKTLFCAVRSEGAYPGGIFSDKYYLIEKLLKTRSVYLLNKHFGQLKNILRKTPLHYAIEKNNKAMETLLIAYEADVNNPKPDIHPLHEAAYEGNLEQVKALIQSGTDVNLCSEEYNRTSLHIAVEEGHTAIVDILLLHKADVNGLGIGLSTPLHIAVKKNLIEIVKLLLKYGANINLNNDDLETPLDLAAEQNNVNMVRHLICADGIDMKYHRPLSVIVNQGFNETMKYLVCTDTIKADWPCPNDAQETALYYALAKDNIFYTSMEKLTDDEKKKNIIALVRGLLDAGAVVHGKNIFQYSPLHMAVEHNHCPEVIQLLLDKGADVNLRSGHGNTPLHLAAHNGNSENVKLLLAHGANPKIKNEYRKTALMIAKDNNHSEIVSLLKLFNQ